MTNTATIGRGLVFAVLLVAGLAKLGSVATYGGDYATLVMSVAQGLLEIYLGVIYASRWQAGIMRRIMLGLFTVFLAYNVYLIAQGASSCGCYGSIRVAPIYSAGLNIGLLVVIYWIPTNFVRSFKLGTVSWGALVASSMIAITLVSFPQLTGNMRSHVAVSPMLIEAEYGFDGYEIRVPLTLTNRTHRQLKIIGWNSNCAAELLDFKNSVLEPGESRNFNLLWKMERMNDEGRNWLINELKQHRTREALENLKGLRVLSFLNQHGEECARCLLQEKLAGSVVDLALGSD
ncbi:MAG: hypothetical protein Q8M16_03855 [Pirellulaceae bacterium]|nr:hypothetical protein [Pirellulaceae bacterium]